ncbi:hypothetical protein [Natrinema gari]|uniref:Uncharacterized protein n=1 Tax=Natrinema gari JCM 14663 TaxID=1230459 RepID=L9Z753_9EURY|nr:hypothetical protein [Natrinema gari]ELY80993.1 hypothetical protein C486_07833 [Natrinema gari JCM 14663]
MRDNISSGRRRFLKRAGTALTVGAGIGIASQSAAAAATDKEYQIEIVPLDESTSFDIGFKSDVDPSVAQEPSDGSCNTYGSTVSGSINSGNGKAVIGVDTYDLESVGIDDGPAAFGAQFIPENFDPVAAPMPDVPKFCQIEVTGNGGYVVGVPYEKDVETSRADEHGDIWGVNDTPEFDMSQFVGTGSGTRETAKFVIAGPTGPTGPGSGWSSASFHFTSEDHIVAMDYNGKDSDVEKRFGPSSETDQLSNRRDTHAGVCSFGYVDGGVDKYQTAGFEKTHEGVLNDLELEKPSAQLPAWMRLEDGVEVNVSTTDTARDCPHV